MQCSRDGFVATMLARHRKISMLPLAEQSKYWKLLYGEGEVVASMLKLKGPRTVFVFADEKAAEREEMNKRANSVACEVTGFAPPWTVPVVPVSV